MPLGRRGRRAATSAALAVALAGAPAPALAYPWTIKDGYAHCASCHVDPSGGGTLTDYGRAQAEILVRTHFGPAAVEDPGKMAEFAFGVLPLPAPLSLQVDTRGIVIPQPGNVRAILMQADLRGAVEAGPVVASASIGAVSEGGEAAWLTSNTASGWNLVSRECWAGVRPLKGLLLRAGRMNLPFGLRTEDHLLFVRSATRTDLNDQQQVGAAASYTGKQVRAEVMGIAGNLQVRPDSFRERGYSAYATFSVSKRVEVGASSMVTAAETDVETLAPRTRQAHGLFTRASPWEPLAILAEADLLQDDDRAGTTRTGLAAVGILDFEPVQGLHVMGITQVCTPDFADPQGPASTRGGAVQWFVLPRFDIRIDVFDGVLRCTPGGTARLMGAIQGHVYL